MNEKSKQMNNNLLVFLTHCVYNITLMKKVLRQTQTLRAGCSKAEPKIFIQSQTPFPGVRDDQNLISWRWSLPSPTDPVWWRSMHAISSYRGNRLTNKQNQRQDRLQYTVLQLARSVIMFYLANHLAMALTTKNVFINWTVATASR